jgi:hypothetical protein
VRAWVPETDGPPSNVACGLSQDDRVEGRTTAAPVTLNGLPPYADQCVPSKWSLRTYRLVKVGLQMRKPQPWASLVATHPTCLLRFGVERKLHHINRNTEAAPVHPEGLSDCW